MICNGLHINYDRSCKTVVRRPKLGRLCLKNLDLKKVFTCNFYFLIVKKFSAESVV